MLNKRIETHGSILLADILKMVVSVFMRNTRVFFFFPCTFLALVLRYN